MKQTLSVFIAIFLTSLLHAQQPSLLWAAHQGSPGRIAVDAAGNVYSSGYFQGTVDFDPGPATFNLTAAGEEDIFITKLDPAGHLLWAKRIGGVYREYATLAVDAAGNVYTTGTFYGTVDFDPGPGIYNLKAEGFSDMGSMDIFIAKLDPSGNFLWAKRIGGNDMDLGIAITLDAAGNVYTTGEYKNTVDFDPGPGVFNLSAVTQNSNFDVYVLKLDPSGNFLWAKSMGGANEDDLGGSISVDAAGNVYTGGIFYGQADFDPGPGTFTLAPVGGTDNFISKLDPSGNFLWAKSIGGTANEGSFRIKSDPSGNVYATGSFQQSIDFDPGPASYNLTPVGNEDAFILKLDASGNFIWVKNIGGPGTDISYDIAVDPKRNVYLTGTFGQTVDFNPGQNSFELTANGYNDAFLLKLDHLGNFLWAKNIGSAADAEAGRAVIIDDAENVYWSGTFAGTVDFDPGPGTFNMTSTAATGAFVAKWSQQLNACTPPTFRNDGTIVLDADQCGSGGLITLVPTSGTAAFLYSINGGETYVEGPATGYSFQNLSAGTYRLRLKDATGCESEIVTREVIALYPCPQTPCTTPPTFRNDATTVLDASCTGSDGNISIIPTTGPAPFLYSIDGGKTYVEGPEHGYTFMNLAPGTYHLRLKAAGGCESEVVTREVRRYFGGPLFKNDGTIVLDASCAGNDGNITIIPTCGAAPFQYSIDGGRTYVDGPASGYTFQNLAAGTYQLRIKEFYGNESAIVSREVKANAFGPCATVNGLNQKAIAAQKTEAASVRAYPNPSRGRFQVQLGRFSSPRVNLQVIDARGLVLQSRTLNAEQTSVVDVDLTGKANGLYLIRVISDKSIQQTKVLLQ